jgi:hypothetical protein
MKRIFFFILIVFAFLGVIRPYIHDGFPDTHDGVNHLARIANYAAALKQGQFPPRWAPTFWGGYGYPVFNYNYPLINILSLPFMAVNVPVELTMKILMIVFIGAGAWGTYMFIKRFTSTGASSVATVAYLTAPFLFNNVAVRGVVGEIAAYALFPHVLLSLAYLLQSWNRKSMVYFYLSCVFFLLSHNIFVLFFTPLLAVGALLLHRNAKATKVMYLRNVGLGILAMFTSCFFWIPAMFEQNLVTIALVNLVAFYKDHFVTFQQLFFSPYQSGLSFAGPVDTLTFQVGAVFLVGGFFAVCSSVMMKKERMWVFGLSILFLGIIFLMHPASVQIWDRVPFMTFAQFPWRLLALTAIIGLGLLTYTYTHIGSWGRRVLLALIVLSIWQTWQKEPKGYIHHEDVYYQTFGETSTVQHENKPRTLTLEYAVENPQKPMLSAGELVSNSLWTGSHRIYVTKSGAEIEITEPTAYFPGWKTKIDGAEVQIEHEKAKGLIHFSVPAGEHLIETRFTQDTPSRIAGNTFAILGVSLILAWLYRYRLLS